MNLDINGWSFSKLTEEQWQQLAEMASTGQKTLNTLNQWGVAPPFLCGTCGDEQQAAAWVTWALKERENEGLQRSPKKTGCCG